MLAVNEALKHNHNIIFGCEIIVRTDHKNQCHEDTKHTNQRVLGQRMAIDQEYGAKLEYFAGEVNTGTDRLLGLPFDESMTLKAFNSLFLLESSN